MPQQLPPNEYISHEEGYYYSSQELGAAIGNIALLVNPSVPEGARNLHLSVTDDDGIPHMVTLGGAAFNSSMYVTFWSSPESLHSRLLETGKRASLIVGHTHANMPSLLMRDIRVNRTPLKYAPDYLPDLNAWRQQFDMQPKHFADFQNSDDPQALYIAVPNTRLGMTTPVNNYTLRDGEYARRGTVNMPVLATQITAHPNYKKRARK